MGDSVLISRGFDVSFQGSSQSPGGLQTFPQLRKLSTYTPWPQPLKTWSLKAAVPDTPQKLQTWGH